MEKFQTFFPFSSPTGPYTTHVSVSSTITNSRDLTNFIANNSSGFLGLSTANQLLPTSSCEVNKHTEDSPLSMNLSTLTEGEVKPSNKKRAKKEKKPKYAFQTRSQVDILDDGYRWRKYGQKAVKNNKFPRSYYRCTYQGCQVKKQVQRLTKDEGVVVTTYEGMHSHSIEKPTDNFEHILSQMQIYKPF